MQVYLQNASFLLLAFFIQASLFGQQYKIQVVEYECDNNSYFLEKGKTEEMFITGKTSSIPEDSISTYRIKGKNLEIVHASNALYGFSVIPENSGSASLIAKIKLNNGTKVKFKQSFEIIELPELCLDLSTSSPDHSFIWLKIKETETGKEVGNEYELCVLNFELHDSAGSLKTKGVIGADHNYFPSISLKEYSNQFEIGDELTISLHLIHRKYRLCTYIAPTVMTINKLWN